MQPTRATLAAFAALALLLGPISTATADPLAATMRSQPLAGTALTSALAGLVLLILAASRRERLPTARQSSALLLLVLPAWLLLALNTPALQTFPRAPWGIPACLRARGSALARPARRVPAHLDGPAPRGHRRLHRRHRRCCLIVPTRSLHTPRSSTCPPSCCTSRSPSSQSLPGPTRRAISPAPGSCRPLRSFSFTPPAQPCSPSCWNGPRGSRLNGPPRSCRFSPTLPSSPHLAPCGFISSADFRSPPLPCIRSPPGPPPVLSGLVFFGVRNLRADAAFLIALAAVAVALRAPPADEQPVTLGLHTH